MKNIILIILALQKSICFAQSKKEQIITLSYQTDSLKQLIKNERDVSKNENNELELKILFLSKKIAESEKDISRISNELIFKSNKLEKMGSELKIAKDSVTILLSEIKQYQNSSNPKSIEYFKYITKENIIQEDYDSISAIVKLVGETKFYVNKDGNWEEAYFEKIVDNKVVLRGFVSSGCGDCFSSELNYYTIDGFLYMQKSYSECNVGYVNYDEFVFKHIFEGMTEFSIKTGGGIFEDVNENSSAKLDSNDTESFKKSIPKAIRIPKTFILTNDKPQVFDCLFIKELD